MSGRGSSGQSGGNLPRSSFLPIGAGWPGEPGIQSLLGITGRPVFQPDEPVVATSIECIEELPAIDLAGSRLVSSGNLADLNVRNVGDVLGNRVDQIPFHQLEVVRVVLKLHGRITDFAHKLESEPGICEKVARVLVRVERLDE